MGCEHNGLSSLSVFSGHLLAKPWESPAGGPATSGECLRLAGQGSCIPRRLDSIPPKGRGTENIAHTDAFPPFSLSTYPDTNRQHTHPGFPILSVLSITVQAFGQVTLTSCLGVRAEAYPLPATQVTSTTPLGNVSLPHHQTE